MFLKGKVKSNLLADRLTELDIVYVRYCFIEETVDLFNVTFVLFCCNYVLLIYYGLDCDM